MTTQRRSRSDPVVILSRYLLLEREVLDEDLNGVYILTPI